MHRKLIAAFFIIALLFNAFGAYTMLESMRYSLRKEIKKKIKSNIPVRELHRLEFPMSVLASGKSEIHWNHKGEFRYRGKMYDIVRRSVEKGCLILFCINDTDEERLFEQLEALVNDATCKDPRANQRSRVVWQLLTQLLFQEIPEFDFRNDQITTFEPFYYQIKQEFYIDVPSPPPWNEA